MRRWQQAWAAQPAARSVCLGHRLGSTKPCWSSVPGTLLCPPPRDGEAASAVAGSRSTVTDPPWAARTAERSRIRGGRGMRWQRPFATR